MLSSPGVPAVSTPVTVGVAISVAPTLPTAPVPLVRLTVDEVVLLVERDQSIRKLAPKLKAEDISGRELSTLESANEIVDMLELVGTLKLTARALWSLIEVWKRDGVDPSALVSPVVSPPTVGLSTVDQVSWAYIQ